jgi:hypothetical protein
MNEKVSSVATLSGRGTLRKGPRTIGKVYYAIHVNPANGQATVAELEPKPLAADGELVHLTLEDGRVVNCQMIDDSPYCAVVGDGPILERRGRIRASVDD